jgi:hypothetical protein
MLCHALEFDSGPCPVQLMQLHWEACHTTSRVQNLHLPHISPANIPVHDATICSSLCRASSLQRTSGLPCRMYCLVRLVQCAALNASRIRLVWGRLWAVVAPHLVSAACAR